jgi:hypothetical protein
MIATVGACEKIWLQAALFEARNVNCGVERPPRIVGYCWMGNHVADDVTMNLQDSSSILEAELVLHNPEFKKLRLNF